MASNRKSSRIPSTRRDTIFGEELHRGTLKMWVAQRTPDHKIDPPYRLHTRAEEYAYRDDGDTGPPCNATERLGCNAYAHTFQKFLDEGLRNERRAQREWWNMAYVLDRLAVHAQSNSATFTLDEMNIAVQWYKGYDLSDAGRSHFWVERACRRVQRYVTDTFLPREPRQMAA